MEYLEQPLGERRHAGTPVEEDVHRFLMANFGGYTAAAGNIFGYWRDRRGNESYGEHRQFTVGLLDASKGRILREFLARIAGEIGEECIYLETGGGSSLIYSSPAGAA